MGTLHQMPPAAPVPPRHPQQGNMPQGFEHLQHQPNMDDLADNMARLEMNYPGNEFLNRGAENHNIKQMSQMPPWNGDSKDTSYHGWIFRRVRERHQGKNTGSKIEMRRMKQESRDLKALAKGGISVGIARDIRAEVKKLINTLNDTDRDYEWVWVYAKGHFDGQSADIIVKKSLTKINPLGPQVPNRNNIIRHQPAVGAPASFPRDIPNGPALPPTNIGAQPVHPQYKQPAPVRPAPVPQQWHNPGHNQGPTGPIPEQDRPWTDVDNGGLPQFHNPMDQRPRQEVTSEGAHNNRRAHAVPNAQAQPEPFIHMNLKGNLPPHAQGSNPKIPKPAVHQQQPRASHIFDRIRTPDSYESASSVADEDPLFESSDSDSATTVSMSFEDKVRYTSKNARPRAEAKKYRMHERPSSRKHRVRTVYPDSFSDRSPSRSSLSSRKLHRRDSEIVDRHESLVSAKGDGQNDLVRLYNGLHHQGIAIADTQNMIQQLLARDKHMLSTSRHAMPVVPDRSLYPAQRRPHGYREPHYPTYPMYDHHSPRYYY
ncbi:hypothetical protein BGW36DRAFT_367366 [Talaromyces proteolyticus]|uniref:Uncharacterized protein n=1 Tax=Talaromyces proteolyticus TaxID=1131652 RepID=A0AAD4L0L0_9EURO|nr:uncharacterized protein BGW36DRAFT_367366 [Talaromyces proteolyticus]KAH8705332.1 hypothetical protein BGW36DRAFT_367366 [Talaromyces proteolyticus]